METTVTPYIHSLASHVPLVIKTFSSLKQFTGQGLEKIIMMKKESFFRSLRSGILLEMFYF